MEIELFITQIKKTAYTKHKRAVLESGKNTSWWLNSYELKNWRVLETESPQNSNEDLRITAK